MDKKLKSALLNAVERAIEKVGMETFKRTSMFLSNKKQCASSDEEWVAGLKADVEKRFGPIPDDLTPVSKAAW